MRMRLHHLNRLIVAVLVVVLGGAAPAATALAPATDVDVLVIGGTPGGIAAAIAAARMGASVILVEDSPRLGGVIATAWLTTFDMNFGPKGEHLTRGIFLEMYRRLGISFDPDDAARVFSRAIALEPGVRAMAHADLVRLIMEGSRIVGAEFKDNRWRRTVIVRAKQVIDATDDGDIAAEAGVPFSVGRPGYRESVRWMQAATLIFRVGGVDWHALTGDIMRRLEETTPIAWGVNGRAAWGYPDKMGRYRPIQPGIVVFPLNLALQRDGSILINALNVTGVNGLDPESIQEGMREALAELPHLMAFLRDEIPGFERAALLGHAPELYIRETRHIHGLYTLTAGDVLGEHLFDDRVAVASYPIDLHPYYAGWTSPYAPIPIVYTLPFRAIVPRRVENLLIASRAFSATSEAHGSARVVPTIMAVGQAAGVAAALCARRGCTPHEIAGDRELVREVQRSLIDQGAYLGVKP